jgi:hypothetical protein
MSVSRRFSRLAALPLALALGASLAAVGFTAATAAAPRPSDSCKKLTVTPGTPNGTLSGCASDKSDDTPVQKEGGGIGSVPLSALASGSGTITWSGPKGGEYDHTSTDLNSVVATQVGGPGQPVDEKERPTRACPTNTQELEAKGLIGPTDSASGDVGGTVAAEVCFDPATGNITLEPGTVFALGEGPNS